jgi:tRNA pseudouridine38-40 synthase
VAVLAGVLSQQNEYMNSAVRRARLVVAYDGSAFLGFAKNPDAPTVAGTLEAALSTICQSPTTVTGAGRTDTGVHAWGQVVSVDLPTTLKLDDVRRSLNKLCGNALVVRSVEWAPSPQFNARFDAIWRHYRYTILNTPTASPFLTKTAWHVRQPLNLSLMRLASDPFIGLHDFTSFCRKPKPNPGRKPKSLVREMMLVEWTDLGEGLLRLDVRANAFCHQQVRAITGTIVDVGLGKITAGEIAGLLRARDRRQAGQVAPPEGLCLWEVGYRA